MQAYRPVCFRQGGGHIWYWPTREWPAVYGDGDAWFLSDEMSHMELCTTLRTILIRMVSILPGYQLTLFSPVLEWSHWPKINVTRVPILASKRLFFSLLCQRKENINWARTVEMSYWWLCGFRNCGTDRQLRIREVFVIGSTNFGGQTMAKKIKKTSMANKVPFTIFST